MKSLKIYMLIIGVNINGIKNIGFNISGVLNKIGLFILKNVGIIDVCLIVLFCLDFVIYINMNGMINVVFVFLKVMINICVFDVIILFVCFLVWSNLKFVLIFVYVMVVIVGFIIDGLWIFIN